MGLQSTCLFFNTKTTKPTSFYILGTEELIDVFKVVFLLQDKNDMVSSKLNKKVKPDALQK